MEKKKRGRKPKPLVQDSITCPWCSKNVRITASNVIEKPAVPAVRKVEVIAEKDTQKSLKDIKKGL